jgi:hypothetical protein
LTSITPPQPNLATDLAAYEWNEPRPLPNQPNQYLINNPNKQKNTIPASEAQKSHAGFHSTLHRKMSLLKLPGMRVFNDIDFQPNIDKVM